MINMGNKLKFIGTGGCFSKQNINNSAYLNQNGHLILFDCGETVFHQMLKSDIINENINRIDIIITHFHADHVGSLGSLIFFTRFKKIKHVNVIFPDVNLLNTFLDISGISRSLYCGRRPCDMEYYLKEYVQLHGDIINGEIISMPSFGYHLKFKKYNLFYSGDTCVINDEIVNKFNNNEIDYIYHEVSDDGYKTHVDIGALEKAFKNNRERVYCMHLGDSVDLERIKKYGFRSVR